MIHHHQIIQEHNTINQSSILQVNQNKAQNNLPDIDIDEIIKKQNMDIQNLKNERASLPTQEQINKLRSQIKELNEHYSKENVKTNSAKYEIFRYNESNKNIIDIEEEEESYNESVNRNIRKINSPLKKSVISNPSEESYINLENQIISTLNKIEVNNDTNLLPPYRILNSNSNYHDYSQTTRIKYIISKKFRAKNNISNTFIPNKKYCISISNYKSTLHAQPHVSNKAISSSPTNKSLHNKTQPEPMITSKYFKRKKQINSNFSRPNSVMKIGQNKLKFNSLTTFSKITKLIQKDNNYDFDDGPPLLTDKENKIQFFKNEYLKIKRL